MTAHTTQEYLLTEAYEDAADLNERIQIQQDFGLNSYSWFDWIFDQINLPFYSRILELGSGPATLWAEQETRLPAGWNVTLSDMSLGMLQEGRQHLLNSPRAFTFAGIEAQSIPFQDNCFDAVIANGLFDHVPDRNRAFSEIYRILKPGGHLYASAGSCAHLQEIEERVKPFVPAVNYGGAPENFGLENGSAQLAEWFKEPVLRRYPDKLVFKEVEPIMTYVLSEAQAETALTGKKRREFIRSIRDELTLWGEIRVTVDKGLFKAYK